MAQLKQELNKSEMNRDELSAELREYRNVKVESRVSGFANYKYGIYVYGPDCVLD